MNDHKPKTCEGCTFAFLVDYGYSNYTVEGTDFYCGLGKHPFAPFDRWYGGDKRLLYANTCDSYVQGGAAEIDVEQLALKERSLTLPQLILWRTRVADAERPPERGEGE